MSGMYKPSGELQGDSGAMPDRGTSTGMTGKDPMTDGRSLEQGATNRIKGISGATKSDSAERNMPPGDGRGQ